MLKKITLLLALLGVVSCGGGESIDGLNLDAGATDGGTTGGSTEGNELFFYRTFYYDDSDSSCEPNLYNQVLSLYYNEEYGYVMIINSQDETYIEGYYSSNFTLSYSSYINDEEADCLAMVEDESPYDMELTKLNVKCVSENYTCQVYWVDDE